MHICACVHVHVCLCVCVCVCVCVSVCAHVQIKTFQPQGAVPLQRQLNTEQGTVQITIQKDTISQEKTTLIFFSLFVCLVPSYA